MSSKPQPGEIWLVNFPFSDLTSTKLRPAIILAVHREEVIILAIFSPFRRTRQQYFSCIEVCQELSHPFNLPILD